MINSILRKSLKEQLLLTLSIVLLLALIGIIELNRPLIDIFKNTIFDTILTYKPFWKILSGLSYGIVSACVFYIIIDLMPRKRRERETLKILNFLIASILDAFNRNRIYGHETAIPHVDVQALDNGWLEKQINVLREEKSNFLPLKFAMQTAYTRLDDFRHALPMAISISPNHAIQWLVITDKVRLLAENYHNHPVIDNIVLCETGSKDDPIKDYKSTLNLRLLEYLEESLRWINLSK